MVLDDRPTTTTVLNDAMSARTGTVCWLLFLLFVNHNEDADNDDNDDEDAARLSPTTTTTTKVPFVGYYVFLFFDVNGYSGLICNCSSRASFEEVDDEEDDGSNCK